MTLTGSSRRMPYQSLIAKRMTGFFRYYRALYLEKKTYLSWGLAQCFKISLTLGNYKIRIIKMIYNFLCTFRQEGARHVGPVADNGDNIR